MIKKSKPAADFPSAIGKPATAIRNDAVTAFLSQLDLPLRAEIERLRGILLASTPGLEENIKWNGPNYVKDGEDRITMRIHPPKQIQLILHRGAKKLAQPTHRLIDDDSGLLTWKENDRAIVTIKDMAHIESVSDALGRIASQWIAAAESADSAKLLTNDRFLIPKRAADNL